MSDLRQATLDAVLSLKCLPQRWEIHVQIGKRIEAVRRVRKGQTHLYLSMHPQWLDKIHHAGLSCLDGYLILEAGLLQQAKWPGELPAYLLDAITNSGDKLWRGDLYAVQFAGEWALESDLDYAWYEVTCRPARALLGTDLYSHIFPNQR